MDRRSVLMQQTHAGNLFMADLRHIMTAADTEHRTAATGAPAARRRVA
jgi:hypothetical protein